MGQMPNSKEKNWYAQLTIFNRMMQLVLFRNDLQGTNPRKSAQQKSLEEHMRMRKGKEPKSNLE